jgi:hypothetical protein
MEVDMKSMERVKTRMAGLIDLKTVYAAVRAIVCWPEPLPDPDQIQLKWTKCRTIIPNRCSEVAKKGVIEISDLYKDERLVEELMDLMTHQAAHFLWEGHPPALTEFLREAGVSEGYVGGRMRPTWPYRHVRSEKQPLRYTWMCPECGRILRTSYTTCMYCTRCPPQANGLCHELVLVGGRLTAGDRFILNNLFVLDVAGRPQLAPDGKPIRKTSTP